MISLQDCIVLFYFLLVLFTFLRILKIKMLLQKYTFDVSGLLQLVPWYQVICKEGSTHPRVPSVVVFNSGKIEINHGKLVCFTTYEINE